MKKPYAAAFEPILLISIVAECALLWLEHCRFQQLAGPQALTTAMFTESPLVKDLYRLDGEIDDVHLFG